MPLAMWSKDNINRACPESMDSVVWTTLLVVEHCKGKAQMVLNPDRSPDEAIDVGALADRYLEERQITEADRAVAREALGRWTGEYNDLVNETRSHVHDALKHESDAKKAERSERWRSAFVTTATTAAKASFLAVLLFFKGLFFLFLATHILLKLLFIKPTDAFRRSERLWVVMTCIILMFTCSIWMHYQKSQQCCEQLRAHLGCDPFDFTVPGSCADHPVMTG